MPEYNFSGLTARSFEQLIQAAAVRVLGPATTIFGDGPDGAREATYEGRTTYPSPEEPWDGYVVIQAKFRQRPLGGRSDAKWVITQLNEELKKFTNRRRRLRRPDYYVFCTNLVLTPAHGTGSKDRVAQLLEQYTKELGGRGFAIWDYDQLRAYLDAYEDVRNTFAAWITPGDVLAEVMRSLRFSRPNFETVMSAFIQKELLADQYVNLEQAGHSADERTPMAQVFIDLPVALNQTLAPPNETEEKRLKTIVAQVLDVGSQRLAPCEFVGSGGRNDGPGTGRYVLIGGPGQGKTTVSQFLCQLHRTAILKGRQVVSEVQQALKTIESQCLSDNMALPGCRRFPLRVTLNHFARELASTSPIQPRSLIGYLTERIAHRTDSELRVDDLKLWLRSYPWLLILDGLDEVPSSSNRDEVLAAIQEFWIDAAESQADILVLATTRPQGYDDDFSPKFYNHRYLTPLSSERALMYGQRLAKARYGNDTEREQRIVARLRRAAAEESTSRLMRSPLQVTIMATLVDQTGQPPHERWRLFHDYYEVIYRRETERDIPAAELLRDHKSNIDEIHHQVGLILQIESERTGLTDAHLSTDQFASVVDARLRDEGYSGAELNQLHEMIIEAAANRLVFLVGVEAGQVGFEIRSLQEFMAAQSLMNGSDQLVTERLNSIAPISHWRNVFLFCAGRCFAVDQHRRDALLSICITQNESEKDELLRNALAGSQLALEVLADGAAHRQPKFERSFARTALRLMDRPTFETQLTLADVYESSMEEVYREEIEKRLDSKLTGVCGNAWTVLFAMADRSVKWALELGDTRWPPTDETQSNMFVESRIIPGRFFESEWCWKKLVDVLPKQASPQLWRFRYHIDSARPANNEARSLVAFAGVFDKDVGLRLTLPDTSESVPLTVVAVEPGNAAPLPLTLKQGAAPFWQMTVAAQSYRASPTGAGLVSALRSLNEVWTPEERNEAAQRLPWPVGACLMRATCKEDLLRMAEAAAKGHFGTADDWKAAEDRWSRGLSLDDLLAFEERDCTIGAYMVDRGFPLSCARLTVVRPITHSHAKSTFEVFQTLHSDAMKMRTAEYLLHMLLAESLGGTGWSWLTGAHLKKLVLAQASGWFAVSSLMALAHDHPADPDIVDTLDIIGRTRKLWVGSDADLTEVYTLAWQGLKMDPSRYGLLPVLAVCSPYANMLPLSNLEADPKRQPTPKSRVAALVLTLAKQRDDSSARMLAVEVAEVARLEGVTELLQSAIHLLLKEKIEPDVGTAFVSELHRHLAPDWPAYADVNYGIDDLLRRRRSSLSNEITQKSLELTVVAACRL